MSIDVPEIEPPVTCALAVVIVVNVPAADVVAPTAMLSIEPPVSVASAESNTSIVPESASMSPSLIRTPSIVTPAPDVFS